MIKKNIIGLSFLAGLAVISCKKNETRTENKAVDSTGVSQPAKMDSNFSQKPDSVKTNPVGDNSHEQSVKKDSVAINSFDGKYVSSQGCEERRYSIELKNGDGKPAFKIFDKSKLIASGNASVGPDGTVLMGEIGAQITGNKMLIQNSGNNMNPYQHFDCSEKYLEFNKQK
ncbi:MULTISPECIES: hypothetical protein [Chryseobacterium]|uniref:Lipoprotein n=1 Tax=Chryseobacterium geocarposphaerae TaxID=1416776 RepID=A0ABU1LGT9_9FLAO|nr:MULTISPECIES: hypothetical protein [Chryseobacterium]MDR6405924.1 hypothetical protein [Chryseobacterium geocarposphaerae]MDR6699631.1 hypothetical protein [Chryseobacterium ginsenosidimutans]